MTLKEPQGKKAGQLNFNTVIGIVAVATIGWVGNTLTKVNDKVMRIETLMEVRSEQIAADEKRLVTIEALMGLRPKQP